MERAKKMAGYTFEVVDPNKGYGTTCYRCDNWLRDGNRLAVKVVAPSFPLAVIWCDTCWLSWAGLNYASTGHHKWIQG
jgi:hypothetical protein